MKCLTTDALLWLENTLMFHIKPSTAPLTHWNHHAEENSPPQSSTEEYSVVLVSTQSQSWTTTWHSINTETKSKKQITFFKMLKCGYFVVYPSVCLHATTVLLYVYESVCKLWHGGMNLIVWACTSVCVCAWLCAGLPTIPLINSSCGLANDCSSPACLSLRGSH